ncbi:ribonuclease Z [Aspergillus lucknowensis]|uniref:ribonuclease Z n=1 Tax=Aspergillus lucknowensis TaxID=176173 RepID=A0ABR4M5G6_9EURO
MKIYYQILSTPTADTPGTTILLHIGEKRYLFGQISEATQRIANENGTKLINVSDIFLTGPMEWSNSGGLIGMILTLADAVTSSSAALEEIRQERRANREKYSGKQAEVAKTGSVSEDKAQGGQDHEQRVLTIHGPRNLTHTLATARRFVFRKGMPVFAKEYDAENTSSETPTQKGDPFEKPTWEDTHIKVWAVPISPSSARRRPSSPRKRNLDEFRESCGTIPMTEINEDQITRQSVVADMFNSSWSLDSLVETRLADVKMPAQLFVRNSATKDLEKYNGPVPGSNARLPDMSVFVRKPWPGATVSDIPTTTRFDESLCYIIKSHDIRGKFDAKKAIALGVKPGVNFGLLAQGLNLTTEDGKVVTPDMVVGSVRPGNGLAVIQLPTSDYVENLVNRAEWKSPSVTSNLKVFLWILGPDVGDHPQLRKFIAARSNCKHIVSGTDYCPNYLAMQTIANSTLRMARLRPDNFPVPIHDNRVIVRPQSSSEKPPGSIPFMSAEPHLIVNMHPEFGIDHSETVPRMNTALALEQMPKSAVNRAHIIDRRLQKPDSQEKLQQYWKDLPGADAEVITLGTGSSAPSKYRNVSGTLLHVPGQGYYLFDCGEGTLGQLKRVFNPEELREVLQNLRLIWISHLHADHHLGTISVLKAWYQENYPCGVPESGGIELDMAKILLEKRLFLVAEPMMIQWLEEYAGVEDFGFAKITPLSAIPSKENDETNTTFKYRHCQHNGSYPGRGSGAGGPKTTEIHFTDNGAAPELTLLLRKATGLADLLTTFVPHCNGAMAVSLVFSNGFKASYSGDCRPSRSFASIGKNSTILIHEATFANDMASSAVAKKHSTAAEAIDIGRQMRARSILLTHFSQRYNKIALVDHPVIGEEKETEHVPADSPQDQAASNTTSEGGTPTVVPIVTAFDYMRVRVRDMFALSAHSPAIERLFTIIERANAEETQRRRRALELAEREKRKKMDKAKKAKGSKKREDGKEKSPSPSPPDSPPPVSPEENVWDASESESGWSESDGEDSETVQTQPSL